MSKTKPIELIVDAYSTGQRHFGENYVKELWEKGTNEAFVAQCPDIKWHFIGHLQSGQVNKVVMMILVHDAQWFDENFTFSATESTAALYDRNGRQCQIGWFIEFEMDQTGAAENTDPSEYQSRRRLIQPNVLISEQLNNFRFIFFCSFTEKSGIAPSECTNLYRHINENCKNLALDGLMTIGAFGHDYTIGPNPDFVCLLKCHSDVCQTLDLSPQNVQISMGMSDDFEQAVSCDSIETFEN